MRSPGGSSLNGRKESERLHFDSLKVRLCLCFLFLSCREPHAPLTLTDNLPPAPPVPLLSPNIFNDMPSALRDLHRLPVPVAKRSNSKRGCVNGVRNSVGAGSGGVTNECTRRCSTSHSLTCTSPSAPSSRLALRPF